VSSEEDRMIEALGDDELGYWRGEQMRRALNLQQRRRRRRHHRGGQFGAPGALGTPGPPAPAGQPYAGALPVPPGNWPGGQYPPPGWSPGQPLPGYPTGWPPPGSPWPGTFQPGVSNVPQPAMIPAPSPYNPYDPYAAPTPQYDPDGNPIYPPGVPAPTIDVTVGRALARGFSATDIVGCLRRAGYTSGEATAIVGACLGW
jgi:hypothetical protein